MQSAAKFRAASIVAGLIILVMAVEAGAQYGSDRSRSRSRSTVPPETRIGSTDRDAETSEERSARRDAGREEPRDKGKPPGLSDGPRTVGQIEEGNWNTLTPEQHAQAIKELRAFAERTKATIKPTLSEHETKYFLFYSDLKPDEAQKWAAMLDRMYARLAELFAIKSGENIFRGKALIFVFTSEEDFLTFEQKMHDNDATGYAGMCSQNGNGDVHVAFYRQPNDMDFAALLVHETAHGFLHRYRKPHHVPTWANEGLAEYVAAALVPQKGKRMELKQYAIGQLRERGGLDRDFFNAERLQPWQYPVAASLAEFMIKANRKNYVAFIDGIKDGMTWEAALTQKYGVTLDRLVTAFGEEYRIRGLGNSPDPRRPQDPNRDREEAERRQDRE